MRDLKYFSSLFFFSILPPSTPWCTAPLGGNGSLHIASHLVVACRVRVLNLLNFTFQKWICKSDKLALSFGNNSPFIHPFNPCCCLSVWWLCWTCIICALPNHWVDQLLPLPLLLRLASCTHERMLFLEFIWSVKNLLNNFSHNTTTR